MNGTSWLGPTKLTIPSEDDVVSPSYHHQAVPDPKLLLPKEPDGWFEYIDPPAEFQDMERGKESPKASVHTSTACVSTKNLDMQKFEAVISNFVRKLVQSTFEEVFSLQRRNIPLGECKPSFAHTYVNVGDESSPPVTNTDREVSTQSTVVCQLLSVTEEVYNIPVDAIDPQHQQQPVRRRKTNARTKTTFEDHSLIAVRVQRREKTTTSTSDLHNKRHSLAYPAVNRSEPIHMTLEEVRGYLKEMHRSPGNVLRRPLLRAGTQPGTSGFLDCRRSLMLPSSSSLDDEGSSKPRKRHSLFFYHLWMKKNRSTNHVDATSLSSHHHSSFRRLDLNNSLSINLKQVFCNVFKPKRTDNSVMTTSWTFSSPQQQQTSHPVQESTGNRSPGASPAFGTHRRALPPVPAGRENEEDITVPSHQAVNLVEAPESSPVTSVRGRSKASSFDFATSIEAVKDYGWYWGPLSGEAAEKILSTEPDGSFIVRDSSDDHYIFSLTFKLSGCIRHVRIEHDHGNFSFGSVTKFKSQTIVEFIEKAVDHSRSGRYLFFLHRRPVLGPMRVQLLHPVSRFKHVQSLQHLCRFVILRLVRRDHMDQLPLPKPLRDYLNSMQYFSETLEESSSPRRVVEHFV